MPYLKIKSDLIDIDVEFKDKYIFVTGSSGVGKSFMVSKFYDSFYRKNVIETDLNVTVLDNNLITKISNYDYTPKDLIVSDEISIKAYLNVVKDFNCYFLIISRSIYKNINFSYRSLYKAFYTDDKLSIAPMFKELSNCILEKYSLIITEDSKYGYNFISTCLGKNQCITKAGGKGNITRALKNISSIFRTVLLVLDAGGIGTHIIDIMDEITRLTEKGVTVHFLAPECFEQLLLCSKYYNYDKDVFKYYTVDYNDTEKFCEEELSKVSKGTVLECLHHKHTMSECWVKQCSDCNVTDCPYRVVEDKFKHVLENGPAVALLKLRKENKNEE